MPLDPICGRRFPTRHSAATHAFLLSLFCVGLCLRLQSGAVRTYNSFQFNAKDVASFPGPPHSLGSAPSGTERNVHSIVGEILRLGKAGASSKGKRFRSLICCITRNDVHLREYVVRNLLAGFGHIVIYDNNQIGKGIDHDLNNMLAPFVSQGAVTLVPWQQDDAAGEHLGNQAKNDNSHQCVTTYGPLADWVAVMDTDEVFYLQHDTTNVTADNTSSSAVGILPRFLDALEQRSPITCGVGFPWRMMYGEHRFLLRPAELLLDAYRRVCKIHDATKLLFRPEWSNIHGMPHGMSCTNPGGVQYRTDDGTFRQLMPEYAGHSHLLHYYQKSVEEWLVKLEQSIPPYIRYIPDSYDHVKHCPTDLTRVTYTSEYERLVRSTVGQLRSAQALGDAGLFLGALPEFTKQDFPESPEAQYALYLYCKLKVTQRQEWDEEGYLLGTPEAAQAVKGNSSVDGLQHFFHEGFLAGARGAWMTERKWSQDE